jgi:hypothetical protein
MCLSTHSHSDASNSANAHAFSDATDAVLSKSSSEDSTTATGSGSPTETSIGFCRPFHFRVLFLSFGIRLSCAACLEALIEVVDDIVDVLDADADSNHVGRDT